jgi:hypothetical protein
MLVSRVAVVVLPASAKFLIDDVMGKQNYALLPQLGQSARRLQEKATEPVESTTDAVKAREAARQPAAPEEIAERRSTN